MSCMRPHLAVADFKGETSESNGSVQAEAHVRKLATATWNTRALQLRLHLYTKCPLDNVFHGFFWAFSFSQIHIVFRERYK